VGTIVSRREKIEVHSEGYGLGEGCWLKAKPKTFLHIFQKRNPKEEFTLPELGNKKWCWAIKTKKNLT